MATEAQRRASKKYYETHKDYYREKANEILKRIRQERWEYKRRCEAALDKVQYIIDYGFDYDGFESSESLKGLIDMLVDYARDAKKILQDGSDSQ